jgi:hypothetical protein
MMNLTIFDYHDILEIVGNVTGGLTLMLTAIAAQVPSVREIAL